jgi:hypothetical protein
MIGSPKQYLLATLCALGAGLVLGWMPDRLIWLGMIYGYLVGEATLRGGGRKRGLIMQSIAGLAAAFGFLVWANPHNPAELAALLTSPWDLVGLGLGVFFAVTHVRYI